MADGRTCKIRVPVVVATGSVESRFRTVECESAEEHASYRRLHPLRRAARWLQLLLGLFLLCLSLHAQSGVGFQYFYDSNGQLIKVVDSSGNVVSYTYDSVGNILSIARSTIAGANTLAILNFTPQQGATGQVVTIQGQGFSTIPSGNSVAFNGTPATVTAATANSLTVAVPSGATTGPITVAVGTSTTTSSTN